MVRCVPSQAMNETTLPLLGHQFTLENALAMAFIRVATAQGKQGIWLLTFPDRENTGNLVNLIFYTGKIVPTWENFENLEFFEKFVIKLATR